MIPLPYSGLGKGHRKWRVAITYQKGGIALTSRWIGQVLVLVLLGVAFGSVLTLAGESTCYCVSAPDSASVCLGTAVSFSVTASGEGTLAYQWYHGSAMLSDGGRISGATSDKLQISNVESADAGEYTVTVTGECGQVTSSIAELVARQPMEAWESFLRARPRTS